MQRRRLIGAAAVTAAATALSGCGREPIDGPDGRERSRPLQWKMVTSWPANFPGLGVGAQRLAETIGRMSGGRLRVKVYGAGELVPAFEVFDAVSRGTAQMGHTAAYYWKGKFEASSFFCAVPFGLNAQEMNGWLLHGGGLELWHELYRPFDLIAFPAGNTGVQMAGWFRREIHSVRDLVGLKMRIPGLGGEVMQRLGAAAVNIPGAELFTALQTGTIDAAEWVGPYNDLAFGLHQAAKFYYYPGWQEPGACIECMIHRPAYEALPEDLREVVRAACLAVNTEVLADYTAQSHRALTTLVTEHKVEVRRLPDEVLTALRQAAEQLLSEKADQDPNTRKVYESYMSFRDQARQWHRISEQAYYQARG